MKTLLETAAQRALFTLDPERAHGLSVRALASGLVPRCSAPADPRLAITVAGLAFPNPLGMAAGYDKNGEVPDALLALGFGFAEIGTVTPRPQPGNPKPRIFRLVEDEAVINRLGFNNEGHAAVLARLRRRARNGIVGVNIGANKDAADRIADYVAGIAAFYDVASYFTVNISSPNTPGLRDLQARAALEQLATAVMSRRDAEAAHRGGKPVPVFLKIAPDLGEADLDDIAAVALAARLDGLIVSNTTLDRSVVASRRHAEEAGGLSGRPLFSRSTIVLARMRKRLGPDFPIIGVGGVHSAETAAEKIRAGADLVQLYTGLIYGGPGLAARIVTGLSRLCDAERLDRLADLRDRHLDRWAGETLSA